MPFATADEGEGWGWGARRSEVYSLTNCHAATDARNPKPGPRSPHKPGNDYVLRIPDRCAIHERLLSQERLVGASEQLLGRKTVNVHASKRLDVLTNQTNEKRGIGRTKEPVTTSGTLHLKNQNLPRERT